ncbi:MAG: TIR domain-containing protein, partial [Lachnospiraceae bacterium]|nr:TIR domain-containing protein [Lachnospiraceae bacterium]
MPEKYRYDAFISYRHCELDSFVSENLHKKLESYTLPKSVQKKIKAGRTKIERVFRDEAELPLSNNLSDPITEALANSEFLIVICTPNLLQSQWCKKEIETFVEMHDTRHVLLVLAEGEPDDSFPEILMHENVQMVDEHGKEVTVSVPREPLAADCRADNDKDRLKLLDNVVLKLCAAMFNLNYDDLRQRHRERQIRRRLIALTGTLAVVTVFALTCLFFALRIHSQNKVISDKYAGAMATASEDLLSQGLRKDALYAVRTVLPGAGGEVLFTGATGDWTVSPDGLSSSVILFNRCGDTGKKPEVKETPFPPKAVLEPFATWMAMAAGADEGDGRTR